MPIGYKNIITLLLIKNKHLVNKGLIITSGGFMSLINIGLHLVQRFLSNLVMLKISQYINVNHLRTLQNQHIHNMSFTPKLNHNDTAISKA